MAEEAKTTATKSTKTTSTNKKFVTCHSGVFIAGGVEFKPSAPVELTREQQEIPAIKNSIGSMLKEA